MTRLSLLSGIQIRILALLLAGALTSCGELEPAGQGPAAPPIAITADKAVSVPAEFRLPGAPPVYSLLRADKPPVIDGKLDDEAWKPIPRLGRMYLDSGLGPMKFDTIARMARDDDYLYLAVDCIHPKISEVPVRKGVRDKVSWAGETVELFLDTDRSAEGYVQVIFDMSAALTDTYKGDTKWNGDISVATDVGGTGWRLEARVKIADLGGEGKVDKCLWGANVCRNTRGQSGSWARILGSYQKPDEFGLLTFSGNELAVEDVGIGIFAPPGEKTRRIPVRMALRNLTSKPGTYRVSFAPLLPGRRPAPFTKAVPLGPAGTGKVIATLDAGAAEKVRVTVAGPKESAGEVFQAELPIKRLAVSEDCLVTEQLTCAIRPLSPVALEKEKAGVYLMAQSFTEKPAQWSGRITVRSEKDSRSVWQRGVSLRLSPLGFAAQLVKLPTDRLKPGPYAIEWVPDRSARLRVTASVDYVPDLRQRLAVLLASPQAKDVLKEMGCALPRGRRDQALVQARIDRLVGYLAQEAENVEVELTGEILNGYRQVTEVVSKLKLTGRYTADRRGWFEAAFYSPVDDSAQPYGLFVPHDYDRHPRRKYALVVSLHGAGGTHGGEGGYPPGRDLDVTDRLQLRPLGRGRRCGYWGVPGNDVINEIRQVMKHYRIDPDRVHLAGGSMGGFGSFEIGANFPGLFATCKPLCGGGIWLPLEQMRNLPTFVHHGLADTVVRPCHSIFAAAEMEYYRCPVQLYLHPEIGHGVGQAADAVTTWETLKPIRRDPHPRTVVLVGGPPALKKAYWLALCRRADPHKHAYLRATFVGRNHLDLVARNVSWMKASLPAKWVDPEAPLQITADAGRQWTQISPAGAKAVYVRLDGEKLEATTTPPKEVSDPTAYLGGADRLLCEGRALRIVYGTKGTSEQTAALAKLAKDLRTWPNGFEVGGYPVLKDTGVTEETLNACDLILLGTPDENALVARMAKHLPVKFAAGKVIVETSPGMQWSENAVAFSLFYRSPLAPARRILWFAGVADKKAFDRLARPPLGADLMVQLKDKQPVVAAARVVDDWKLARIGPLTPAKSFWATPGKLEAEFTRAVKESFPVDVSLVPASDALGEPDRIQWDALTVGEALAVIGERDLMIVSLTGKELLQLRKAGTEKGKEFAGTWVGPAGGALEPEATYQVLIDLSGGDDLDSSGIPIRQVRFVPGTEFEAIRERFAGTHVKP